MAVNRKTVLMIAPAAPDPAALRRLLAGLGHIGVTAAGPRAALKALGTVRFDVIFTSIGRHGDRSFLQELRTLAPGSALVGIHEEGRDAANEAWLGECDAVVKAPLSASRMQWALDFELRYFGS